jgi:hypothetical protein
MQDAFFAELHERYTKNNTFPVPGMAGVHSEPSAPSINAC